MRKSIWAGVLAVAIAFIGVSDGYALDIVNDEENINEVEDLSDTENNTGSDVDVLCTNQEAFSAGELDESILDYSSGLGSTGNINDQDYVRWSMPVYSYLAVASNGILKVDASNKEVKISLYSNDFKLIEKSYKTIKAELPLFGGFYAGKDGYYIVYGQENKHKSDAIEVFRVVKYDKNFNRLGSDSLKGANTTDPFAAGSLRMAEYGGYLYIRTCHKMYGGHQANVMIEFDENAMKIVDSYTNIMNIGVGYVSHSFNQFIMIDDEANIVGYDHGDAYPRAAVMGVYAKKAGYNTFCGTDGEDSEYYGDFPIYKYSYALQFKEASDPNDMYVVNATGAALGDISYSKDNYLASGASVAQDSTYSEKHSRNIFVSVLNRNTLSSEVKWLTNYSSTGKTTASAPHLVKFNDDKFLIIWNINSRKDNYGTATGKVGYAFVDGSGNLIGNVKNGSGNISDCEPVLINDNVSWYTSDGSKTNFYHIDADGVMTGSSLTKSKIAKAEMVDGVYVIAKGGKLALPDAMKTIGDTNYKIDYSEKGIANLSAKGILSGKKVGSCTIKVTQNGKTTNYDVRVEEPLFDKILYVNKGDTKITQIKGLSLMAGECLIKKSEKAEISPISGKEAQVHGLSENRIAIKGKIFGKTALTFKGEGKQYKINVRVCDQIISGKDTIKVGKKVKLKVKRGAPVSSSWKSSNPSVATVDADGNLEALSPGKTTITVSNNEITVLKNINVQ